MCYFHDNIAQLDGSDIKGRAILNHSNISLLFFTAHIRFHLLIGKYSIWLVKARS